MFPARRTVTKEDFIRLMNEGGWNLESGSRTNHLGLFGEEALPPASVLYSHVDNDQIVIVCGWGEVRLINDKHNELSVYGDPSVARITLKRPYGRSQNPTGFSMLFTNSAAEKLNSQHAQEKQMHRREREREKHCAGVNSFLAHQLELAGNGRIVRFVSTSDGAGLVIEFQNGHRLFICGGTWDTMEHELDPDPDEPGRFRSELYIAGSDTFNPDEHRSLEHEGLNIVYNN